MTASKNRERLALARKSLVSMWAVSVLVLPSSNEELSEGSRAVF